MQIFKVKREACWALCNATSMYNEQPNQVKYLVQQGIKPLCELLKCPDIKIVLVALGGISVNILEVGETEVLAVELVLIFMPWRLKNVTASKLLPSFKLIKTIKILWPKPNRNHIDRFFDGGALEDETSKSLTIKYQLVIQFLSQ